MRSIFAGALAGAAATAPMTLVMKALQMRLGGARRQPLPPRQITRNAAARFGLARRMTTTAAHFGFGSAAGAAYGPLAARLPGPALARGVLFGLGVWGVSYLGWLPAAALLRPATREHRDRNAMMLASHVVWGAATALAFAALAPRVRRPAS